MQDALEHARAWVDADAPVLWLLGKTQAGKTSIVAEMTGQGHDEIGRGYRPMTQESRIYAFPPEQPALRFLDTRGLADSRRERPRQSACAGAGTGAPAAGRLASR